MPRATVQCARRDSNPQPPDPKSEVLTSVEFATVRLYFILQALIAFGRSRSFALFCPVLESQ